MAIFKQEKVLSLLISIGGFLTTTLIWTEYGTDPVNLPKALIASGFAFAILFLSVYFINREILLQAKAQILILTLFLVSGLSAVFNSQAPFSQNFYGVFGRSTGFLTYLVLALFLLGSSLVRSHRAVRLILIGLLAGGIVNVLYCSWVLLFGDFVQWNNIYKAILGTLGNPNFVSSYLGMFNAALFAVLALKKMQIGLRIIGIFLVVVSVFLIKESNSIQGLAVTAIAFGVVGFYFVRARFVSSMPSIIVAIFGVFLGGMAVAGSLSHGPLKFIYKPSVSLRGTYWEVATRIGNSHPLTGVGFDTYGDWYRVVRPERALINTPPITVHSNTAHNVVLEMFASGGWPLLLTYLGIIALGIFSIVRLTLRQKKLDYSTVAVIACWTAYMSQSIISINQVGLAVWGWILTGLLIAADQISKHECQTSLKYETTENVHKPSRLKIKVKEKFLSANLVASIGLLVGIFVAFPPLSGDGKWRRAVESKSLEQVTSSLTPSVMNPASSLKYVQAIQMFANSNLPEEEYRYSKLATQFNINSFEAWRALYASKLSTQEEKQESLQNMKRLDPLNPNVLLP